MIYLFTLQRQFFLCCVYTHIDLDWPGFSFLYLRIITITKQPILSCHLVDRVEKKRLLFLYHIKEYYRMPYQT